MKMKKRTAMVLMTALLCLAQVMPVMAAPEDRVETMSTEETDEGTVKKIRITRTYDGKAPKQPKTYTYDGETYELVKTSWKETTKERYTGTTDTVTETIELPENKKTLVPRYKKINGHEYELDEDSLNITVAATEERYGTSRRDTYEDYFYPDNDLDRVAKNITKDGINYKLLEVEYSVSKYDEETGEIPAEYKAHCHYGGTESYSITVPVRWTTPAVYTRQLIETYVASSEVTSIYSLVIPKPAEPETEAPTEEPTEEETEAETEPETEAETEPEVIPEPEEPSHPIWPIAAGGAAACGVFLFFFFWIFRKSAKVVCRKQDGTSKTIGHAQLKTKADGCHVYIGSGIAQKADTSLCTLQFKDSVVKKSENKSLTIHFPDKMEAITVLKKEVPFHVK